MKMITLLFYILQNFLHADGAARKGTTESTSNDGLRNLVESLLHNSKTSQLLEYLYRNRGSVYIASSCFIFGTSLLIAVILLHNPLLAPPDSSSKKRVRRMSSFGCESELQQLIVEDKYLSTNALPGAAGDERRDTRIGRDDPWSSSMSSPEKNLRVVSTQPTYQNGSMAEIMKLCRQRKPLKFSDVLELKEGGDSFVPLAGGVNSAVYRFRDASKKWILKVIPMNPDSVGQAELFLRNLQCLNRLRDASPEFVCNNFVKIEDFAVVKDEFPKCLQTAAQGALALRCQDSAANNIAFDGCRHFMLLSMEVAGTPLSRCAIKCAAQAKSIVQQLCFTIAAGEKFAGYVLTTSDPDKVLLRTVEKAKIDFCVEGISVVIKLIDGMVASMCGTSFTLMDNAQCENQLIEMAERKMQFSSFRRNTEFLSQVITSLLDRIPKDVPPEKLHAEQKTIFDLLDIQNHLRSFDSVYRFIIFKYIRPRQSKPADMPMTRSVSQTVRPILS